MALTPEQVRKLRRTPHNGNRLKAARDFAGLTQVELCKVLGFTQSAYSDLERQRYSATTVPTARRFAEFYGCSIEDLFPANHAVAS